MKILAMLKGLSGEFEINRVLGALGVGTYIFTAAGFQWWELRHGGHFDVVAFCAAYPTGLGVALGAVAGAVSLKDRNVATALQTRNAAQAAPVPVCENAA